MVVGASLEHHGRNNNSTGSIMEVWYRSRPTTVTVYGVVRFFSHGNMWQLQRRFLPSKGIVHEGHMQERTQFTFFGHGVVCSDLKNKVTDDDFFLMGRDEIDEPTTTIIFYLFWPRGGLF